MREIRWTEQSEDHIARHGVTPDEVEQAVHGRPYLLLPGKDDVTYWFGTTNSGRHLLIVLVDALDGRDYVATARDMTISERRTFRRKGR
ncbi:hypothetical protein NLX83_04435 [Allokutzneria sp. A3M-2-11 16]|uniref:hypothetical protein n=1 Tax=Allokutzneria sp. A3M-2-11 16 TaxID=2962043 RepID=UPI0020B82747|nr:hypothetical protein [Allokutzneria sp. A3M-2-11 16]MCP3798501.1 hypothetical protein [Allokutzneria sp. A3M-2-11 16]